MNFLGILLFPFTLLYDLATRVRNYLYDIDYRKSFVFDTCVVAVGNLSVGGTGKTPMVEYLIRLLKDDYKLSTLSRGYGRKTKGFRLATGNDTFQTLGDEPKQFYEKYGGEVTVAVGEERAVAIPFILAEKEETQVILLDDAYQHRAVKPNHNILLTDFSKPFYNDFVLPSGRLREARKGASRADAVVVTKCPADLSDDRMHEISQEIKKYTSADIFFSSTRYLKPKAVYGKSDLTGNVFLFSGIASSTNFERYVADNFDLKGVLHFGDHHAYTESDVEKLIAGFEQIEGGEKCLLTTEKDMVKFLSEPLKSKMKDYPLFYLPIETYFLNDGNKFDSNVIQTVKSCLD